MIVYPKAPSNSLSLNNIDWGPKHLLRASKREIGGLEFSAVQGLRLLRCVMMSTPFLQSSLVASAATLAGPGKGLRSLSSAGSKPWRLPSYLAMITEKRAELYDVDSAALANPAQNCTTLEPASPSGSSLTSD